jgi:hypothetical protein
VNHKTEIGFVEPHAERDGGNQRLDLVAEHWLDLDAFHAFEIRVISAGRDFAAARRRRAGRLAP